MDIPELGFKTEPLKDSAMSKLLGKLLSAFPRAHLASSAVDGSEALRLEAQNFQGPAHWDWALTTAAGEHLACHEVRLDPESMEYQAMTRLQFHVRWHSDA